MVAGQKGASKPHPFSALLIEVFLEWSMTFIIYASRFLWVEALEEQVNFKIQQQLLTFDPPRSKVLAWW